MPDPSVIMRLALAYRSSMVLFAASELDFFSLLAGGAATADDVAAARGTAPDPTRLLLDACVAEGLLTLNREEYALTATADAFLVKQRPAYIGHGLKYAEDLYPVWGELAQLVRSGRPAMVPEEILGNDPEKTRAFIYAMHERARGIGAVLPHGVDLTGRRHLLDVGGGPGTYSISLVKSAPGLRSTILDLPAVLEITREIVAANGCADRIDTRPGNYLETDFGRGYDAVLLSGMMHRERPADCQLLLRKAFGALDPGGIVIVSDVFFDDEERRTPAFATYFALSMMLTAEHGTTHSKLHMARWMDDAGFRDVEIRDLPKPNPHRLVIGRRP
ncbi:MAG TPA: methyltransferase [Vicinamibacterales bacterium]|nr:methyltransferase [Vicinamibacterales bacterium]